MTTPHAAPAASLALLTSWIERAATPTGLAWLRERLQTLAHDGPASLPRAIGLAPRKLGKADLPLTPADHEAATALRPGFDPIGLSIDQAARIALLLASARDEAAFADTLETLFRTADLGETVAYYRGFPLFPAPERLLARAAEGVRSAVKPVFEAIAHRNPYPRERFAEDAWNQMVLKALFIGADLAPIQGLDERANPDLARMLVDYAHERWSAGRPVSPELWRCVGPFADERAVADLTRLLASGTEKEREAAQQALAASRTAPADQA